MSGAGPGSKRGIRVSASAVGQAGKVNDREMHEGS